MKALITGASSGMGFEFAKQLSIQGYDLIIVARRKNRLKKLKEELSTNVTIIEKDLSIEKNVYDLYDEVKKENIDLLINNAGFGLFGDFVSTSLS